MRNAFGTGHTEKLLGAQADRHPSRHFTRMLELHRTEAVIRFDAADKPICVRPTEGGRMGDSNEPELFMGTFYKPVERWHESLTEVTSPLFESICPITNTTQDLSRGGFIDDLIKIFIIPEGSPQHALLLDKIDNTILNRELHKDGYAQNVAKQDTLVHLRRAQDTKQTEKKTSVARRL